jgi:hypothetical protein
MGRPENDADIATVYYKAGKLRHFFQRLLPDICIMAVTDDPGAGRAVCSTHLCSGSWLCGKKYLREREIIILSGAGRRSLFCPALPSVSMNGGTKSGKFLD